MSLPGSWVSYLYQKIWKIAVICAVGNFVADINGFTGGTPAICVSFDGKYSCDSWGLL